MIFTHNNPHLWVQTTFMSLWFYSVASNHLEKWCTHWTTFMWWLSPLFRGVCFAQSSARLAQLQLSCLVNIKHLTAQFWPPSLLWGQFNKSTCYGTKAWIYHFFSIIFCLWTLSIRQFILFESQILIFWPPPSHLSHPSPMFAWVIDPYR